MKKVDDLFRRAKTGELHAICWYADYLIRNRRTVGEDAAIPWLRRGARIGSAWAEYSLGFAYQEGLGVRRNQARARKWYERSAAKGYDSAQLNLGIILANLPGSRRDLIRALALYRLAAIQGNRNAAYNLGLYYELGRGVRRNLAVAGRWYFRAASAGQRNAAKAVSRLSAERSPLQTKRAGA